MQACREWIDTPFRHQGRALGRGVDCAGVIVCAARKIGIDARDDLTYDHAPDPIKLRRMLNEQPGLSAVARDDEQPGDLLLMLYSARATHLAVQTEPDRVLHAYADLRKVVETTFDQSMRDRVVARYRFQWHN